MHSLCKPNNIHTFVILITLSLFIYFQGCSCKNESINIENGHSSNFIKLEGVSRSFIDTELGGFHCLSLSPDGSFLAAGTGQSGWADEPDSAYGHIFLWNLKTGDQIGILKGHKQIITSLAFSPDSKFLLSGDEVDSVRLWSVDTLKEVYRLEDLNAPFHDLTFLPDGKRFLITSGVSSLPSSWPEVPTDPLQFKIFNIADGKLIEEYGKHQYSVLNFNLRPGINKIATTDGRAHIWDTKTKTELQTFDKPESILSIALSPNGKYLLTGSENGIVTVRNISDGKVTALTMHTKQKTKEFFEKVSTVAISNDGVWAASGGWSKILCIWQIGSKIYNTWKMEEWVSDIAFSYDNKYVYASCWSGRVVEIPLP